MDSITSSFTSSMSLAEKTAYAEKLEMKLEKRVVAIAYFNDCVAIEAAATLALNQFQKKYTRIMINRDPLLQEEEKRLIAAKTKAWNDRFAAEGDAYPPTLESILWIVAKSGFTKEVAPFMNLSKATRECKNLQRYMREARFIIMKENDDIGPYEALGMTQLLFYCWKGMTSSVVRMLEMTSIDIEARQGADEGEDWTCFMTAAAYGHVDICRLLLDKGAVLEARDMNFLTTIHVAANRGHVEIIRLLCDRGVDVETERRINRWRPLIYAARQGHISVVRVLIEERNAKINARESHGRTALWHANRCRQAAVAAYLVSHGGVV